MEIKKERLAFYNRDPERDIPTEPKIILSPADGFIDSFRTFDDSQHVIIEMRYTDVHVQRVPMDGEVIKIEGGGKYKEIEGDYYKEYELKKMLPKQKRTVFKTEIGDIAVRQITSFFANRIKVWVEHGEKVKKGQRLGKILIGSTIVLELPKNIKVLVKKGQDVFGGKTIIAKY